VHTATISTSARTSHGITQLRESPATYAANNERDLGPNGYISFIEGDNIKPISTTNAITSATIHARRPRPRWTKESGNRMVQIIPNGAKSKNVQEIPISIVCDDNSQIWECLLQIYSKRFLRF